MGELSSKEVMVFMDDLIIFYPTLEELMKDLEKFKEFGLKLYLEKCTFFQTSLKYLEHISQDGIKMDPDKNKTLTSWLVPQNLKEVTW